MINYSPNGVLRNNLSVIRQKGQSHNGYYKKKKHVKLSGKQTYPTP